MATTKKPTAGVIGLGSMGLGVARTLLKKGFQVHACDARPEVTKAFEKEGGVAANNPAEVGRNAGVVIVLVVNAEQTNEVLFGKDGAVSTLASGSVVIASSTVAPEFAIDLGKRLDAKGLLLIDAPVSGGAARAATGELSIMASGSKAAFNKADAVLKAIAVKVYELGEEAGTGSKVKMINQLLAGVHIAASAEAMALAIRVGADPKVVYEVISNSAGSSWMFQNRVPHILDGDYTPRSAVNIFVKDLGIVLDSARKMTFPLPLTAAAHQLFLGAAGAGLGYEDDSAVVKMYQAMSGIELPKKR
ncbi:MAG: L-threonate dehydrogenase [Burkholderiales bacterium]|jgi:putative dehydrogenase